MYEIKCAPYKSGVDLVIHYMLRGVIHKIKMFQLARQRMQDFTRERIFGQWVQLVEEVQRG